MDLREGLRKLELRLRQQVLHLVERGLQRRFIQRLTGQRLCDLTAYILELASARRDVINPAVDVFHDHLLLPRGCV